MHRRTRHSEYRGKRRNSPNRRRQKREQSNHWTSTLFGLSIFAFFALFQLGGISIPSMFGLPAFAYYPKCDAARFAGVAPIAQGQPGYRSELDDDGDGLACEPYLGPR